MKIQCDECGKIFNDDKMILLNDGENCWGLIFRKFYCNKCFKLKEAKKK